MGSSSAYCENVEVRVAITISDVLSEAVMRLKQEGDAQSAATMRIPPTQDQG